MFYSSLINYCFVKENSSFGFSSFDRVKAKNKCAISAVGSFFFCMAYNGLAKLRFNAV
tara:strand:+ start:9289 stop:9462 length:174 start_codon:yes stop_codon:yes gene_type:complete